MPHDRQQTDHLMMGFLYGELTETEAAEFEARVAEDAGLRAELDGFRRTREAFSQLPMEEPPPALTAMLLHEAAKQTAVKNAAPKRAATEREQGGFWAALTGLFRPLMQHPAAASLAGVLLVGGVAGALYMRGVDGGSDYVVTSAPAPSEPSAAAPATAPAPRGMAATEVATGEFADELAKDELAKDDGTADLDEADEGTLAGADAPEATPEVPSETVVSDPNARGRTGTLDATSKVARKPLAREAQLAEPAQEQALRDAEGRRRSEPSPVSNRADRVLKSAGKRDSAAAGDLAYESKLSPSPSSASGRRYQSDESGESRSRSKRQNAASAKPARDLAQAEEDGSDDTRGGDAYRATTAPRPAGRKTRGAAYGAPTSRADAPPPSPADKAPERSGAPAAAPAAPPVAQAAPLADREPPATGETVGATGATSTKAPARTKKSQSRSEELLAMLRASMASSRKQAKQSRCRDVARVANDLRFSDPSFYSRNVAAADLGSCQADVRQDYERRVTARRRAADKKRAAKAKSEPSKAVDAVEAEAADAEE